MQLANFISCYGFPLTPIFLILLFLLSQSVREILSFDKQQEQQIHREVQPENSIVLTHFFFYPCGPEMLCFCKSPSSILPE